MLEQEGALATWQLARDPTQPGDWPIPATRIFDHPLRFLSYEGPLRRAPGAVSRVDAGTYDVATQTPDAWTVALRGGLLRGGYTLHREAGDAWQLGTC